MGLTEDNPQLLWSPAAGAAAAGGGPVAPDAPAPRANTVGAARFALARAQLSALHPAYIRLLIDWAALQPDARRPPALEAPVSGCARALLPCAPYAGIRDELAAIASQQRASAAAGGRGYQAVLVIFGTPAWAARPPSGCEAAGAGASSRAPAPAAIPAYRALIRALLELGRREGVALEWWAPWNEPNNPYFLSPQRASCAGGAEGARLSSPASYSELVRAAAAELSAAGGARHLVLGELGSVAAGAADSSDPTQFLAGLPQDVLCDGGVFSLHAYATRGASAPSPDAVGRLEAALDARGQCTARAPIWVTESGAGAPQMGQRRPTGAAAESEGCIALAREVLGWYRDPRVGAVFQYTFREDPAFPVGLLGPDLSHVYPTYRLWRALARAAAAGQPPPAPARVCSR